MSSEIKLHPRQAVAFYSQANEFLYGGAAGGGKSYFLRVSAIRWCLEVPGIQVYIFRRTNPDLKANHLRGPTSFNVLLGKHIESGHVKYKGQDNEFVFWNGSRIALSYCQYENDVEKFQGAEIHVLMMDELTHFTEYIYNFLRSRVRMTGLDVPKKYLGRLPRIECGSNPGSIGHAWVKRNFVTAAKPEEVWKTPQTEGGMSRQYIPAKLQDNPSLMEEDPMYLQRLEGLANPALVAAMRDGDWDIIAGAAFDKWDYSKHVVAPFAPPSHWTKVCSMDWGSSKPFSIGWWCVSPGEEIKDVHYPDGKYFPRGAVIRYREWYGWNGTADEGCRMESTDVARGIIDREQERITYRVADAQIFAKHDGPSIADRMASNECRFIKSKKDRTNMFEEFRARLMGVDGYPLMYVTSNCTHFIRTIPDLILDERTYEDVDTHQEDHVYDETGYMLLSCPWIKKAKPVTEKDIIQRPTYAQVLKANKSPTRRARI